MAREGAKSRRVGWAHVGTGAAAGVVAGTVMLLIAMAVAAVNDLGVLSPLQLIAATFLGPTVAEGGALPVIIGLVVHYAVSIVFGALFVVAMQRQKGALAIMAIGGIYGLLVFLFMLLSILPWVNPLMAQMVDRGWFLVQHLAYGVTLGAVTAPALRRLRAPGDRTAIAPMEP